MVLNEAERLSFKLATMKSGQLKMYGSYVSGAYQEF